jgi:hypothetical protein
LSVFIGQLELSLQKSPHFWSHHLS